MLFLINIHHSRKPKYSFNNISKNSKETWNDNGKAFVIVNGLNVV